MSNWARRGDLRDPLDVLISREAVTCKGCRFLRVEKCFGETVELCGLGKKKMRKCSMFAERS